MPLEKDYEYYNFIFKKMHMHSNINDNNIYSFLKCNINLIREVILTSWVSWNKCEYSESCILTNHFKRSRLLTEKKKSFMELKEL